MKKILLLILSFLSAFCTIASSSEVTFRHITVEDGLSSNHVRSLIQDSYGYIWIGTEGELNRYDGRNMRAFAFPQRWTASTILALLEDGRSIWIGTDKGLFVFSYDTQAIERVDIKLADGDVLESMVNGIVKDEDGNLWFSTMGQGVFRYNPQLSVVDRFDFPLCENRLASVYVDRANQVWALTNWGGPILFRFNKTKDMFDEFPLICGGKKIQEGGLVLLEDSRQRFWLGSWTEGLYEIDRITGHVTRHLTSGKVGSGVNHIHSAIEYNLGQLAIGSDDGILMYNVSTGEAELFTEGPTAASGLSNRFVYPLLKDSEGGLWAGTYYGGVNYRSSYADQFKAYTHTSFDPNSVGGKIIGRFCEDGNQNIWIASDDGGLSRFNPKSQKFVNYGSSSGGLSNDNIHALCLDGNDLWVGTYAGGVNVLDMNTGKFRVYLPVEGDETSISGTSSYAIMKDMDGNIWVATMEGIDRYDRRNDSFRQVLKTNSHVIDIDQDHSGNLWFSTVGGGILKLDPETNSWKTYRMSYRSGSPPSNHINCGFVDSRGVLWFCTNSGLCTYDEQADSFMTVPMEPGISKVYGIEEDQQVYWIATNLGLVRMNPSGEMQIFSVNGGLRSSQFVPNAMFKASDGCIYIGTTNGFNAFYPYKIRTNHVAPEISIVGLTVDNKSVPPGRIKLSHQHNSLTIEYAAMSFCVPEKNQYSYILEGLDSDWNDVGNCNRVTYSKIPAGSYTFAVKGTNNDGVWSDNPAVIDIVVKPHPLLSTSCKILYLVLVILLVIIISRTFFRKRSKEYESQIKDMEDRKETEVYEAKIKFFTMIAHEIRTPVSLIIGPLENIMKNTSQLQDKMKADLQTIDSNSRRLLFLINQLLDFRKVEQDAMVLHFVSQPITPLLNSVCERFESAIKHRGAELAVEYPPVDFDVCVDSEALTKLISNLLTNASKYTKSIVRVSCYISPDNEREFCITVYDDGCGISPEEQAKIFMPFYQTLDNKPGTGIGLSLVKSIAELHGGSISVISEVGSYTSFTATLPVNHEASTIESKEDKIRKNDDPDNLSLDDILKDDVIELLPEYKPVIMIVDDNEDIVRFLSETLSDNYSPLTAYNGHEALQLLETHPDTSLIIADWMMPGMDGVELCRRVRSDISTSHMSFILLTAKTDDPSKIVGMDCGADLYIEKPFSLQYLEACIRNQVAMRSILRQRYSSLPLTSISDVANTSLDNRFLQTMTNLIEANLSDSNLSVDFLTEQMGVSRSSFYNKIKSLTNHTPNELIQLMRLKKAAQLLTEHKYRINEICYMVGFNNPSYFSKCFYKQFGMKPGEFASRSTSTED